MKALPECILDEAGIAAAVEDLADRLMPLVDDDTVAVCLLSGGLWFTADLTRALARRGRHLCYDGLWLSSYGDAHESSGRVDVYAPLQRSVIGRTVLLLDDVLDSGRSILKAKALLIEAGAAHVITTVFARKPWPEARVA
ncbi:MAG: phosphoribosyltransferase, partial [Asticcacaulis sp.]